jgi:SAM-dependent methyltransferase
VSWESLADHAGSAYLRYSFTKGTEQEVAFLVEALDLAPGSLVLDAGCGPGRHGHALARRGMRVVGVDLATRFVALAAGGAPEGSWFLQGDVRRLPLRAGAFDAVVCLCQGGFGLLGGDGAEEDAVAALAGALRPGGRLALTAFSAYYAIRWLAEGETFDPATGVHRETTEVRGEADGAPAPFELDSTCFTPRELRLMAERAGLVAEGIWSVEPGRYGRSEPQLDRPEWLMVARRPGASL